MNGLLIKLRKRRQDASGFDPKWSGFFVFGYYDELDIIETTSWSALSPEYKHVISTDYKDFSHEIIAKLIKPEYAHKLEREHNEIISFSQGDTDNSLFANKPLLTVVFLRYTKETIASPPGPFSVVNETNRMLAEFIISLDLPEADRPIFAVYPTIGFMDAAVVCRSNNYANIAKAIFHLRTLPGFLYTSYVIPCAYAKEWSRTDGAWVSLNDPKTEIMVSAILKPGISAEAFFSAFSNKLKSIEKTAGKTVNGNNMNYITFGIMDALVIPHIPMPYLMSLFAKEDADGLLPQLQYHELITSLHTTIRIDCQETSYGELSSDGMPKFDDMTKNADMPACDDFTNSSDRLSEGNSDAHNQLEAVFHDMLTQQTNIGDQSLITRRNIEALRSMACFYFDITHSPHNFDIRSMMDPVLVALMKNIKVAADLTEKPPKKFTSAEFNHSIANLRDTFTDLMNDYARAERRMFEGRWLKHSSTASTSKLVLAYHLYLCDAMKWFPSNSTYTYLTASGGVDDVAVDGLFSCPRADESKPEHRLLVLRLPEAALFNPAVTLFHIYHEFFHFIGERRRKERNIAILKSLAIYITYAFTKKFLSEISIFPKKFCDYFEKKQSYTAAQRSAIENEQRRQAEDFRATFPQYLLNSWERVFVSNPPKSQFMTQWNNSAYDVINKEFNDNLSQAKRQMDRYFEQLFQRSVEFKQIIKTNATPEQIKLSNEFHTPYNKADYSRMHKELKERHNDAYAELEEELTGPSEYSISSIFMDLGRAAREAFSDLYSATLLQSRREHYLNTFHTRSWKKTDLRCMEAVFRIGGVLRTRYDDHAFVKFMTGDTKFDVLISELFNRMQLYSDIIDPIVDYLKLCADGFPDIRDNAALAQMRFLHSSAQPAKDQIAPQVQQHELNKLLQKWAEAARNDIVISIDDIV